MRNMLSKISRHLTGWLLAVCFTASMFMCSDADCLTGNGDEDCASLLCSLLSKHETAPQNAASGMNKDCSCVCHVPTVIGPVFNFNYHPASQYNTVIGILQILPAYNRLVYHPPAAV
jgi:hypothetical protein